MPATNHGYLLATLTANLTSAGKDAARQLTKLQQQLAPILQQQDSKDMLPPGDFFSRINFQAVAGRSDTSMEIDLAGATGAPPASWSATPIATASAAPTAGPGEAQAELRVFRL